MGTVHTVRAVLPAMLEAKAGTILITGATASVKGSATFATFAAAKVSGEERTLTGKHTNQERRDEWDRDRHGGRYRQRDR